MTFDARRALLQASGYEIRFREHDWVECLLIRGEETWHGRGVDRTSALAAAIKLACPSHFARAMMEREVQRLTMGATIDADREAFGLPRDRDPLPASPSADAPNVFPRKLAEARHVGAEVLAFPADAFTGSQSPNESITGVPTTITSPVPTPILAAFSAAETIDAPHHATIITGIATAIVAQKHESTDERNLRELAPPPRVISGSSVVARSSVPRTHSTPPPLVRRDAQTMFRMDPPRALEELDILMDRIRDSKEELGLCSPERQRLAMLAWICEARAHTDTFPEDIRIRDRVGSISRQLTEIGKTFWPGSVTALQLQMQPRDLPRHVLGGPASTWARAAELAERALRSVEYSDERRGYDAYGWADAPNTLPPPSDPNELFGVLSSEVERLGGALPPHAVPRESEVRPDPETFRRWIRTLRWLRLSDVDPDRWARIAGRLRWWACHREAPLATAARELEASFAPEQPWARELGVNEEDDGEALITSDLPKLAARRFSEEVLESIRSAMSGKRMVFVSNRRDPDLQTRLKDALPAATLDWKVAEPKRLEALGEAIQQGAYDVVLGAIGFQSQGTDHLLARACRQAGVKYIRVNRGRPIACLRALARELSGASSSA